MPKAISTDIAPAVKKFTNIPSRGGGYQYAETGPQGEAIDNPEQFAQMNAKQAEAASGDNI